MPAFAQISKRLKSQKDAVPPGNFSFGTQNYGGPQYTDAFRSKRGPSLTQLVENYAAIIYAMVDRNRNAVARLPMRLLADGSRAQGKPARACDPIRVSREVGKGLAESGQISTAAIDQVYEVRNHPLLDVVNEPDPYGTFTREQFIGTMVAFMDVVGSAYIVPEGNGWDWRNESTRKKGPPEYLWVVYPQYTIPVRLAANPIVQYFQYFSDRLPKDAVVWLRHTHSLRDVYGSAFSPTYAGESYRQQEQEQVAILSQLYSNARPQMIISPKDALMPFGENEAFAYEQDFNRKLSQGGAGGLLVLRSPLDVTPVSYQPADLGANEVAKQDITLLAAIFGQPPTYYTVDSNLANLQAANAQHDMMGVQPRCKTIAGCFTRLAKQYDPRLMFQFDPGLPEDELLKAQVDKIYFDAGAVTINEWGEEKRYAKKPYGDAPWLPGTLKQPDMIMAEHEQMLEQNDQAMEQGDQAIESGEQADVLAADQHEHQKKMDKEGLKIDAKKAAQKPAAKRALTEDEVLSEALEVIRSIKGELERRAS